MENNTELKRKGGSDADPTQPKVRRTGTTPNTAPNEEENVKANDKIQTHTHTLFALSQKMTDASGKMVHSREKSNYST